MTYKKLFCEIKNKIQRKTISGTFSIVKICETGQTQTHETFF